jgi:hypothetical protein
VGVGKPGNVNPADVNSGDLWGDISQTLPY